MAGPIAIEPNALRFETDRPLGLEADAFLRALQAVALACQPAVELPHASHTRTDQADAITALLIGSRNDRFGPRMSPSDEQLIRSHVTHWMQVGQPVHLLVMWGGLKHYVTDEEQGIDLAEFFAVQQFQQLAGWVRRFYPPGVIVLFCLEDFGVWYEDACGYGLPVRPSIERSIETYGAEFTALLGTADGDWARPLRFHDLVGRPYDQQSYVRRADHNLELLHAYWAESAACTEGDARNLESYRALQQAGWSGIIPSEMRAHYLKRLTKLYPSASLGERVDRLLRYFAMVLLYQQLGVFGKMGGPLIKVSMYKPSPGIPEQRISGRIHLRCLARRLTSQVMPPWTCKGCFRITPGGRVGAALQSFPLAWQERLRFEKGRLLVSRGQSSAVVRADLLLPDTIPGGSPLVLKTYGSAKR